MIEGINDPATIARNSARNGIESNNAAKQTSASGATFVALDALAAREIEFVNTTGTAIDVRYGTGVALNVPDGAAMTFSVKANASELQIKRSDSSNTQVTITYNWRKW